MRVAPHQLGLDGRRDLIEGERARLLGEARVEDDLKQQVAELIAQALEIAARDGIGHLVGLLDRVGRDRREGLPEVPRAAGPRVAQARHDREEPVDRARGRAHSVGAPVTRR